MLEPGRPREKQRKEDAEERWKQKTDNSERSWQRRWAVPKPTLSGSPRRAGRGFGFPSGGPVSPTGELECHQLVSWLNESQHNQTAANCC